MAVWVADQEKGLFFDNRQVLSRPCQALCRQGGCIFAAGPREEVCLRETDGSILFSHPLPGGVNALCPLGGHICALSGDSDSLCAFSPRDGRLCLSAPAGSYPRDLCPSPCGRYAAVAGGGAGEVLLFDGELNCIRRHRVPGAAVSLCFLPRTLAVLCAVGEENISSRLMLISQRGVVTEGYAHPSPPCALCALPGGRLLMGCHGCILHFARDFRLVNRQSCVCPARIRIFRGRMYYSDAWQGCVKDEKGQLLYRGGEPLDMCIT